MFSRQRVEPFIPPRRATAAEALAFPFSATARVRWLVVALLLLVIEFMTRESIRLGSSDDGRLTVLSAMTTVLTVLVAAAGFAFIAASAMAVVRDTANGCDAIVNWPGTAFMDWTGDALLLVNGICISVAAGLGLGWVMQQSGCRSDAAVVGGSLTTFLLFPVVLLSLLENESVFDVVSPPVWRTFVLASGTWIRFYLAAAMIAAVAGILVAVVWSSSSLWVLVVANLTWSGCGFSMCRMLGWLAFVCADRAAAAARQAEAAAADEEATE